MRYDFGDADRYTKIYDARLIKRLVGYLKKKEKFIIFLSIIFALIISGFQLLTPYITRYAIDNHIVRIYYRFKPSGKYIPEGAIRIDSFYYVPYHKRADFKKFGELGGESFMVIKKEGRWRVIPYKDIKKREIIHSLRQEDKRALLFISLILMMMGILRFVLSFLNAYLLEYVGQSVTHRMRVKTFYHTMSLPVPFFDKTKTGTVVTRNTNDIKAISTLFTSVIPSFSVDVVFLLGIFFFLPTINWRLSLLVYFIIIPTGISIYLFRNFVRKAYREVRKQLSRLNAFVQESLSGIRVIHLFNSEKRIMEKFEKVNEDYRRAFFGQMKIFAIYRPLIDFFWGLLVAVIMAGGGAMAFYGMVSIGTIVAFISYAEMVFSPIRDFTEKFNVLQAAMTGAERVFSFMDIEEENYNLSGVKKKIEGDIKFENVYFAYDKDWVLKGINLEIKKGEKVAIVGSTGAGKTTITNLLLAFYSPQKGRILIDGIPIEKFNKRSLRRQIGMVLQDVFLFTGSLVENITLGYGGVKDADRALNYLGARRLVLNQRDYMYQIVERGENLSTGERQLISFARAVNVEPSILVLDEATSNVDTHTEHILQKAMNKIMEERTSLIIAHRLSTVKYADRIVVIHNGRIVEEGRHDELMKKKGYYYNFYKLQFMGQKEV